MLLHLVANPQLLFALCSIPLCSAPCCVLVLCFAFCFFFCPSDGEDISCNTRWTLTPHLRRLYILDRNTSSFHR